MGRSSLGGVVHQHDSPFGAASTMAEEGTASWGNWGMRDLSSEPRTAYNNDPSYAFSGVAETPWQSLYAVLSSAADGITAINNGVEIGDGGVDSPRALAFAKFNQGIALSFLGIWYDQAFVFDENVNPGGDLTLEPYGVVMAAGLAKLDQAITMAEGNSFTLPPGWMNGITPSNSELAQIMRSYKARYMASVARTPTERDAVNWNDVLANINAGITGDLVLQSSPDGVWFSRMTLHATDGGTWMRADYKTIGWTDESGGYINWLASPVADRDQFELDTRDLRIWGCGPSGDAAPGNQCRSVDGSTSRNARLGGTDGEPNDQEPGLYFRFYGPAPHPASRGTYHWSMYHHWRYEDTFQNRLGPMPHITVLEMDLLQAEAYIRLGQEALAVPIINATRTANGGLPEISLADLQCPPVKPACTLMDQMIYEKRMETFNTGPLLAFTDRRGWGPLSPSGPDHHQGPVEGTPLHMPVPGRVLAELGLLNYTFGGVGNELGSSAAATISRAVPARGIYAFSTDPGISVLGKLRYLREAQLDERRRALRRQ